MSQRIDLPFRPSEHETAAPVIGNVARLGAAMLPDRDLDRQPTVRAEAGAVADLWVQACSLAGRSHTEGSSPSSGQDSYSYRLSDDGSIAVFAVADGLGSRRRSHVGAQIAAVQACASFAQPTMAHLFDGPLGGVAPDAAVIAAIREVQEQVIAADGSGSGRDVATTLLVALLRVRERPISAVFVRIGDPSALLMEGGRFTSRSLVFGQPADGPANSLAGCLPMKDPTREIEVVRVGALPDGVGVVLVTDGVGNDLRSPELRDWLEQRWARPLDAPGMIDTLRYRRQGSVDDRTAVVVLSTPTAVGVSSHHSPRVTEALPAVPAPLALRPPDLPRRSHGDGPVARRGVHRRRRYALVGAGAAVAVAVGAVALATRGGSTEPPTTLPQWIGPGQQGEIVVSTSDGGVEVLPVTKPPARGSVITSQPGGGLITVDCQGRLSGVGEDRPSSEQQCEPVTLAVPDGDQILVLSGARLHARGSAGPEWELPEVPSAIRDNAVDAARWGEDAVVVGDGRVAIIRANDPKNPVPLEEAFDGCQDAHYVAAEADGNELALVAACSGGRWAVASVAPNGPPCLIYAGTGDPPVPVRTARGQMVLAFGTPESSDRPAAAPPESSDRLAAAPLDPRCT